MAIKLKQITRNIKVNQDSHEIKVRRINRVFNVNSIGRRGAQGPTGATGPQGDQGEQGEPGEDKNFVQEFTNLSEVTVTHSLSKYPAVTVTDSTGDEVEGEVEHVSINQLVARFSASFTGRIVCN